MTDDAAHPVEDRLSVLRGVDVAVVMVMRAIRVHVCMRIFSLFYIIIGFFERCA